MRLRRFFCGVLVASASLGMVLPQSAFAASTQLSRPASSAVRDVALHDGGSLTGQVLDASGTPVAGTAVAVIDQGRAVASTQTGVDGRFAIAGVKAGVYEVATSNGVTVCRLWAPRTAPPAAQSDALVVHGDTVVRGAVGGGGVIGFLSNPWVLGGIVAAAIAIPLILDDDDAS
jgi:hypothetical protein